MDVKTNVASRRAGTKVGMDAVAPFRSKESLSYQDTIFERIIAILGQQWGCSHHGNNSGGDSRSGLACTIQTSSQYRKWQKL